MTLKTNFFLGLVWNIRSSHPKVFRKKGAKRNFAKLTGKHLCQSLFFNKVAGLQLHLKRDSDTGVFLSNLRNFSKHLFYGAPLVAASDIPFFLTQDLKNFLSLEDNKEYIWNKPTLNYPLISWPNKLFYIEISTVCPMLFFLKHDIRSETLQSLEAEQNVLNQN